MTENEARREKGDREEKKRQTNTHIQ